MRHSAIDDEPACKQVLACGVKQTQGHCFIHNAAGRVEGSEAASPRWYGEPAAAQPLEKSSHPYNICSWKSKVLGCHQSHAAVQLLYSSTVRPPPRPLLIPHNTASTHVQQPAIQNTQLCSTIIGNLAEALCARQCYAAVSAWSSVFTAPQQHSQTKHTAIPTTIAPGEQKPLAPISAMLLPEAPAQPPAYPSPRCNSTREQPTNKQSHAYSILTWKAKARGAPQKLCCCKRRPPCPLPTPNNAAIT